MVRGYSVNPKTFNKLWKEGKYNIDDFEEKLRKLLKYYPKNFKALKPITVELSRELSCEEKVLTNLYFRIVSKYKREFLRHFDINIGHESLPFWRKTGELKSLQLCNRKGFSDWLHPSSYDYNPSHPRTLLNLSEILKTNKRLETLEFEEKVPASSIIFNQLKYVTSLRTICIKGLSLVHLRHYKKLFISSKATLENVTIIVGAYYKRAAVRMNKELGELFRMVLESPRLKVLKFSSGPTDAIDINKIPFNMLRKRNITYYVHIPKTKKLEFSVCNQIGLAEVNFLGIHFKDLWINTSQKWDKYYEDYFKAQEKCQRTLILGLFDIQEVDLSEILKICKNVTILDVILSCRYPSKGISFTGLKYLVNLKHAFIELSSIRKEGIVFKNGNYVCQPVRPNCSEDLFTSLVVCSRTLKSVHLHLYGQELSENEAKILSFFNECADTLIEFTLKFTSDHTKCKKIGVFYKGLSLLRRVESINILIQQRYGDKNFENHKKHLESIFSNKIFLRDFGLFTPLVDSENVPIAYEKLTNISKLSLSFFNIDQNLALFKKSNKFINLSYLELSIAIMDQEWKSLLRMLQRLKKLEVFILDCRDEEEDLITDLEMFFKQNKTMKFLAVRVARDKKEIKMFVRENYSLSPSIEEDLNNFFGRNQDCFPEKYVLKKYLIH